MKRTISDQLFEKAKTLFPGGVNSPVRAFKAVGGHPLFIERGEGAHIYDADGNGFIDFCCSYGPLILGHAPAEVVSAVNETVKKGTTFGAPTKLENELAEMIISNHSYIEKIRFVNSGTEAVMSGVRLARGYTGRDKIIKFEGCYHGHVDSLMVNAGSGLATLGTSSSAGVPEAYVKETIVLPLHDEDAVKKAIEEYKDDIACIIIEPIPANNGLLLQDKKFLQFLRDICTSEGIMLFFDEVISGFRVGFEGAAGLYGIAPDIISFGKIIGGGLPVGAYGASNEIMSCVAPDGPVYQAGTLSGNPVAMAAGKAQIKACLSDGFYENLERKAAGFAGEINAFAEAKGYAFKIFRVGSIFWVAFTEKEAIVRSSDIDQNSMANFKTLHGALLERGVYIGPSGFEVGFISRAHSSDDLKKAVAAFKESLEMIFG
ncbi:glutamate-1-semialdehyde 2,1-aminomutase [Cryomorpha ignava]|uniref:Glutamate-1-semialdehyde 2,1-aminomutase n=1 Tax=Cryomorpha ignava TaxID=101383 RepID=A0A7K3WQM8_9FLAO|nr:glutamate-1-semialdehyde 2,1-aminomutase [Cryomorpha ignava]NEN23321.1 glutamate-1-semialdehyde 2,1-aminomutase [Cryomorpha ignava]